MNQIIDIFTLNKETKKLEINNKSKLCVIVLCFNPSIKSQSGTVAPSIPTILIGGILK